MRMLYTHTLVLFVAISHPLAGADPVPAMAAVDPAHEPSGKADHAQVHHHEQQEMVITAAIIANILLSSPPSSFSSSQPITP